MATTHLLHTGPLDLLIDQISELVIVLCGTDGTFLSWHPAVLAHFGYTAEEFIGRHLELLDLPAERQRGAGMDELREAARSGRFSTVRRLTSKDGGSFLAESVTIALRDSDGKLIGYGKILRDVTALKRAEDNAHALSGALEGSNVFIRRWNGAVERWMEGCETLYGWSAREAVGKIADELLRTQFPVPPAKIQEELRSSGRWQGEMKQFRKDGSEIWVHAQWLAMPSREGEDPLIIATHTDITARLRMQQELEMANERLNRMAQELERSNEELEEFARIASHDLSAPILSTRWLVDLLATKYGRQLDEEGRKCLKQISLSLERMADLVEAILSHAQVGVSAIGSIEKTGADEALAMSLENLRRDIETSGAVILHEPLPMLPIQAQPLAQLFQNLLSNAIKYRRPGVEPLVRISAEHRASEWVISVEDNGIGIEPEWTERIFLPLQRRHGMQVAGSGIGLATCKKIVTLAGGKIWVESQLEVGSTFYFTFPAAENVSAANA
jgi:PAS domain S-box-containing protein